METPKRRRAITLAGGGPAAGLHIGVLRGLDEFNKKRNAEDRIDFEVWALSCIGAWVGIVYNQFDGDNKAEQTEAFFRDKVFRDDASYERFPINRAFGPDVGAFASAWGKFVTEPQTYDKLVLPAHMMEAALKSFQFFADPLRWTREGDRNEWFLNNVLAVNPAARFLVSLMYLSEVNGLTKIYYKDSSFLKSIKFEKLEAAERPDIYHNAWKLKTDSSPPSMQLFHNRPFDPKLKEGKYKKITDQSLCACSALPYIEQTVSIEDVVYCEGALVDTVNFKDLLEDNPDLDEVWVSRIVDVDQVTVPNNIHDGLANLCMLFAAELGENDVKLFKQHLRKRRLRKPRVIEIPVARENPTINFCWNHANLQRGVDAGRAAIGKVLKRYCDSSSALAPRKSSVSAPSVNPA